ncbi:dihydrolipoamide acetyltransferase family protein [Tepidiforma sp.]|uniref:dihydrolipoamide acetyltransferase family protein n=1 Tax=Tepidiforma sp. TaxID=2682230 RepID=UPI002ADD5E3E|nr:dihydrolipoamide acetyltransferase family protein [Tepidiforma sp.]
MAINVTMPQMGADMVEGTLVKWLKQPGDVVKRGDVIAEIETDKATVELEAFESGTILKLVAQEGEVVPVGDVIAILGEPNEAAPEVERKPVPPPAKREIEPELKQTAAPAREAEPEPAAAEVEEMDGRVRISPVARRIAREAGLDVRGLRGSGPDGRILRRDVEAAIAAMQAQARPATRPAPAAAAPAPTPPPAPPVAPAAQPAATGELAELSKIRKAIAHRMTLSKQTQPHYYLTLDVDMTAAMAFRAQLNAALPEGQRVTVNDLIVKACALALARHPKFNAEFSEEGLRLHERINICIGIALDEGLIAPALLDCQEKSLGRIALESKDLIERARAGRLTAAEYGEGTFTITNLGAYGVETLIGIINPGQAAILGVGSVMPKPVIVNGEIAVREVMKIALSADHRVTDGAEGARFIKEIQAILEQPASLAL